MPEAPHEIGQRAGDQKVFLHKAQRVDGFAAVGDDRPIKRHTNQLGGSAWDGLQPSAVHLERAAELYFDRLIETRDLPRIITTQPVVRTFTLPTVFNGLLEYAVFVAQPVPHRRQLHRRHRVEKTSREPSETAISEARIGLLLQQPQPVEVSLLSGSLHKGVEQ